MDLGAALFAFAIDAFAILAFLSLGRRGVNSTIPGAAGSIIWNWSGDFQLPTSPALEAEAGLWQMRATELNAARGLPMSGKGTTSVVRVQNINTGESMTWIATESKGMPRAFEGLSRPGEVYVEVAGHAEQSVIRALGGEWQIMAGGTSTNVCWSICQLLVEQHGLTLGGPVFGGRPDKTPFRLFLRPQ